MHRRTEKLRHHNFNKYLCGATSSHSVKENSHGIHVEIACCLCGEVTMLSPVSLVLQWDTFRIIDPLCMESTGYRQIRTISQKCIALIVSLLLTRIIFWTNSHVAGEIAPEGSPVK